MTDITDEMVLAGAMTIPATGIKWADLHPEYKLSCCGTARRILEAAIRAMPASGRDAWQPIDAAPKDGTTIIIGRWMDPWGFVRGLGYYVSHRGIEGWIAHSPFSDPPGVLGLATPTHWMPLPSPPAKSQEGEP